jgi:CheY-like chemotaxis protein
MLSDALEPLASGRYDVVVLEMDANPELACENARTVDAMNLHTRVVFTTASPTLEDSVLAMRHGVADLLLTPLEVEDVHMRLAEVCSRASRLRQQDRRVERLKRICRRLTTEQEAAPNSGNIFSTNLAGVYEDIAEHVGHVSLATEFSAIIRPELDVEGLLRTTLEYMLTRTGPTNAAVFLPTSSGDFGLGAYINYDLPKEMSDILLDQLADTLPERFRDEIEVCSYDNDIAIVNLLGEEHEWMRGSQLIVFACREKAAPFDAHLLAEIRILRDLFSEQLAKVVRVHNRALPKGEDWFGFDVGDNDEREDWGKAA